jgi:hypothetical protein
MDKYREFYTAIPPKQITSCDSFQVLNYYLIIRIFSKAFDTHKFTWSKLRY